MKMVIFVLKTLMMITLFCHYLETRLSCNVGQNENIIELCTLFFIIPILNLLRQYKQHFLFLIHYLFLFTVECQFLYQSKLSLIFRILLDLRCFLTALLKSSSTSISSSLYKPLRSSYTMVPFIKSSIQKEKNYYYCDEEINFNNLQK